MSKLDDILDEPVSYIEATTGNEIIRESLKRQIKDLMYKVYDEDYHTFKKNLEEL